MPFDKPFDYNFDKQLEIGDFVKVPFGRKEIYGVVWNIPANNTNSSDNSKNDAEIIDNLDSNTQVPNKTKYKIKNIITKSPICGLSTEMRDFICWTAKYSMSPIGSVLALTMSAKEALEPPSPEFGYIIANTDNITITAKRQKVLDVLEIHYPLKSSELSELSGVTKAVIKSMEKLGIIETIQLPQKTTKDPRISPEDKLDNSTLNHDKDSANQNISLKNISQDNTNHQENISKNKSVLSESQQHAANILVTKAHDNKNSISVLDGVTGSGKTEVYFEAVEAILQQGKQALILLPEIALTSQLLGRFQERFQFESTSWHSHLTKAKRRDNWRMISCGEAKIIIGARSALYLPYKNLGIIIVDEEHESAFKQEDGVIYHGRDMAVVRSKIEEIPIILASASPSLETIANIKNGRYQHIELTTRHGKAIMPSMNVIDMRMAKLDANHWISEDLKTALQENLSNKQQSLLYLNRRGYAPLTLCRKCGYRFQCKECSSWLVEHRISSEHNSYSNKSYLQCHHCDYRINIPNQCPDCQDDSGFASCGPGVERLREEVVELFPQANVAIMTSDNANSVTKVQEIVQNIENGTINIIIGTQMIAKGYHFPNLTLVGIIDADLGLEGGDIRAAERTFQLLHQVSGRAGRSQLQGKVLVQSYSPVNPIMQALISNNRNQFNNTELKRRKMANLPPYSRMASFIMSGQNDNDVKIFAKLLVNNAPVDKYSNLIKILGPAPAPMTLLRGNFRHRILIIAAREINIQNLLSKWLISIKIPNAIKVKIDIDPYNFM